MPAYGYGLLGGERGLPGSAYLIATCHLAGSAPGEGRLRHTPQGGDGANRALLSIRQIVSGTVHLLEVTKGAQFLLSSTSFFSGIQGIVARNFSPTFSIRCSLLKRRRAFILGVPA